MNSLYGSFLTDKTRFKDIRICTSERQGKNYLINPISTL